MFVIFLKIEYCVRMCILSQVWRVNELWFSILLPLTERQDTALINKKTREREQKKYTVFTREVERTLGLIVVV